MKLLRRAEDLAGQARDAKAAARARLEDADRARMLTVRSTPTGMRVC